ncbi:MAG TPA: hypothetical protein VHD90_04700 [Phototrophicaceae bacterium]|nr:hypothetical protein [Phototrophicaceae bacterium]
MQTLTARAAQRVGFTADDLRANQQGKLAERQREIARHKYRASVSNGIRGLLIFWLAFVVLLVVIQLSAGTQPQDKQAFVYVFVGITLILFLIAGISLLQGRDLRAGRVFSVEGVAQTRVVQYRSRYGSSTGYELLVGGLKFRLDSREELAGFENGLHYRVYYIRYAPLHVLLSAEALDAPS